MSTKLAGKPCRIAGKLNQQSFLDCMQLTLQTRDTQWPGEPNVRYVCLLSGIDHANIYRRVLCRRRAPVHPQLSLGRIHTWTRNPWNGKTFILPSRRHSHPCHTLNDLRHLRLLKTGPLHLKQLRRLRPRLRCSTRPCPLALASKPFYLQLQLICCSRLLMALCLVLEKSSLRTWYWGGWDGKSQDLLLLQQALALVRLGDSVLNENNLRLFPMYRGSTCIGLNYHIHRRATIIILGCCAVSVTVTTLQSSVWGHCLNDLTDSETFKNILCCCSCFYYFGQWGRASYLPQGACEMTH